MHMQVKHHLAAGGFRELLHCDALRIKGCHRHLGDLLRDACHVRQIIRADVENIASGRLRDDKRMTGATRHDVEKRQRMLVLENLVAGEFAAQDFGKGILRVISGHEKLLIYSSSTMPLSFRNGPVSASSRPISAT